MIILSKKWETVPTNSNPPHKWTVGRKSRKNLITLAKGFAQKSSSVCWYVKSNILHVSRHSLSSLGSKIRPM